MFKVLEKRKHDIFNELGVLKSVTEKVWYEIACELNGKLSPTSIFLTVFHDRHNFQTKLKTLLGITSPNISLDMTSDEDIFFDESSSISHTSSKSLNSEKQIFKFNLPYDLFRKIYPQITTYKNKTK
jgi:hypothetical protein